MKSQPAGPLAALESLEGYRGAFMNPVLWQPFIRQVCARHAFPCRSIRPGLAGSFPTFIVDEKLVVKFFGRRFDGPNGWRVEQEAAGLAARLPALPAARLLAAGPLAEAPSWSYLVFNCLPGASFGDVRARIPRQDRLALAAWLGKTLRALHAVRLPPRSCLPRLTAKKQHAWAAARQRQGWPGWPESLSGQIEAYLGGEVPAPSAAHLIHADLTADHLLVSREGSVWKASGIIDFGDACCGDLFYELAALHLDLFAGDRAMLAAFLEAYRPCLQDREEFPHKAMRAALGHQFEVFAPLFARRPRLARVRTLDELADHLWNVDVNIIA